MFRSDLRRQSSPSGSDCVSQSVLVWRSEINDTSCLACCVTVSVTCRNSWRRPTSSPVWPPGPLRTHSSRWRSSEASYLSLRSRWPHRWGSPDSPTRRTRRMKGCSCSGHTSECLSDPGSHLRRRRYDMLTTHPSRSMIQCYWCKVRTLLCIILVEVWRLENPHCWLGRLLLLPECRLTGRSQVYLLCTVLTHSNFRNVAVLMCL